MLPEQAAYAIAWANAELVKRKLPQTAIHRRFNEMLATVGLEPVSWSSFSRHALRIATRETQASGGARASVGKPRAGMGPRLELARTVLLALLIEAEMDAGLIEQAAATLVEMLREGEVKPNA